MKESRPIVCRNFLPGVDLFIQSRWIQAEGIDALLRGWQCIEHTLHRFVEQGIPDHVMTLDMASWIFTYSRQPGLTLADTAMQLTWETPLLH